MNLKEVKELGIECGLKTWGEAIRNVEVHAGMCFSYEDIPKELKAIHDAFDETGLNFTDKLQAEEK